MSKDKLLFNLSGGLKTPTMSTEARIKAGHLLRLLQQGNNLSMPHSRSVRTLGPRCHELRINDHAVTWRIIYRVDSDAIIVLEMFSKKTRKIPRKILALCKQRLAYYDDGK